MGFWTANQQLNSIKINFGNLRKHAPHIVALLFHFINTCSLQAQGGGTRYLHFTRHDVLASNQVNCIVQDRKKFIWLGTSNGMQRFDGSRWRLLNHQKNNVRSLPDNEVL